MTSIVCEDRLQHGIGCVCHVIPPHLLRRLAASSNPAVRTAASRTLEFTEGMVDIRARQQLRTPRRPPLSSATATVEVLASTMGRAFSVGPAQQPKVWQQICDAQRKNSIPGIVIADSAEKLPPDEAAQEAWRSTEITWQYFFKSFRRNSIDDEGMLLTSTIHYMRDYDNAFWTGHQMVYGDGDGISFTRFTKSLDVIAHELTHGVTQYTAQLKYQGQPGSLNESFSDVFGCLVSQWHRQQDVRSADWLIGADLIIPGGEIDGLAIRSLKAPGTAHSGDPQPDHMSRFVDTTDDHGGVHINSGIPNLAFYLAAMGIGGNAWEKPARIWYAALTEHLNADSDFQHCAAATIHCAGELYGLSDADIVREAWAQVGVTAAAAV